MRNISVLFLTLLLLTSCRAESSGSVLQEATTSSSEQTTIPNELIETSDDNNSTSETSLSDSVFLIDEPYSFSEVNSLLGPGPFSVNELSEIFGKPSRIEGYYVKNGYYVISVMFKDAMFDL